MVDPNFFDAHTGIPIKVLHERNLGRNKVIEKDFLESMREGGITARFASVYVKSSYLPEMGSRRAIESIEAVRQDINESEKVSLGKSVNELRKENKKGKYALMLSMEGAEPIQNSLRLLNVYYDLGVRMMTLTHSRRNDVGTGSYTSVGADEREGGISDFGEKVIRRMEELGMAIDISHLNDEGFWDVIEITDGPVVASHSNARALCDNPRNLTDEQLKAIAEKDGVVGLASGVDNFVKPENADLEDFLEHLDYMVGLIGVEHVGFGFDYWEYLEEYFPGASEDWGRGIKGMSDSSEVDILIRELKERGYSEKDIEKMMRENFLTALEQIFN
jgi:membrane dipeptidase